MQTIKVGLIGYGMAAQVFHAPVINAIPQLELAKVVERHGARSRQRYPWVEVVNQVAALWQDEAIELVVIATPNSSHFDLARQALLAHKHVVVDKPFTVTSAEAQQLLKLAQQQGKIISVHHNRRWDGDFLTVQQIITQGYLGQLVEYEAHYDRFRNYFKPQAWREAADAGGGILFDLGSHLLDQAQVLFGWPQAITADIRTQRAGGQSDDSFDLRLDYESLKVTLKGGMLVRETGPRFILHGTQGSFVKSGFDPQEAALKEGRAPQEPNWGIESPTQWGLLNSQLGGLHFRGHIETLPGCYQAYYQNVYEAITQQTELIVTPETARNTIRLIEFAWQSHHEKRTIELR